MRLRAQLTAIVYRSNRQRFHLLLRQWYVDTNYGPLRPRFV